LDPALYATSIDPRVSHINVGTGEDVSIASLARTIAAVVGFSGRICFDPNQPDGAPRKLLDVSLINRLGWHARIDLQNGLAQTYDWFLANQNQFRGRDSGD
jgi:GDP-L-fucose synthase